MAFFTQLYNIGSYVATPFTQCRRPKIKDSAIIQSTIPLDALPNVVVVTNKEGQILDINKIGADLLGYAKTELLGKHRNVLTKPSDEKQAPEFRWTISQETPHNTSSKVETFVRKDGSLFSAKVSTTRLSSQNGAEQFVTTIIDCTEHQRKLHTTKMYAIDLLHDTRGSLGVIRNGLDQLEGQQLSPVAQETIDSIRVGAADIASLVNDTLDLEKVLAQDTPELLECYLHQFLKQALKPTQELAKAFKKKFKLSLDTIPPSFYCSFAKRTLGAVLRNLLSNAIKFTPDDCKNPICCEISLTPSSPEGTMCLSYKVTNQGKGFTPEQKTRMFTLYQQASSEVSEKHGGTGIGLPQSKEAIEKAGGSLDAESIQDQITTFYGTLPIRITQAPATPKPEPIDSKTPKTPSAGRRVLFVDDQSILLRSGSNNLAQKGHTVETAKSVVEALNKAVTGDPEILITDLNLGTEEDGINLAERLKRSPRPTNRPLKTILLTGTLDESTRRRADAAGIDRCILKGGDPQVLQNAITELCTPPR